MAYLHTQPYAFDRNEGPSLRSTTAMLRIKASSEQTGGAFNLFEMTLPTHYETGLHILYTTDVAIYVLEGELTVFLGPGKNQAQAGWYGYQPRGTPHGFRVTGQSSARLLYLAFPAGLDRFFIQQGRIALDQASSAAAARYKIEILGSLPE